ncbi:MAG TPA: hypothetical protein PLL42_04135 [Bacilli bacterium]|nr:hypothetical protein [Bacilli bacterium]
MKKVLRSWLTYVVAGALFLVAAGIAVIPDIVDNYVATMEEWYAHYIFLFIGIALIFVGFVWQDLLKAQHRRKTKNWDGPLSEDVTNGAWAVSLPFYLAAVLSIIGGIIFTFVAI